MGSLTGVQRDILIGTLLGDGAMRCKANALLEVNHSVAQRAYVDWKFEHLQELCSTPPRLRKGNGNRFAYRFCTRSLPELTPFYRLFYRGGTKSVPRVRLSPRTLAVWFMDDGSRSRSAVYLNTQQFTEPDQWLLVDLLFEQWELRASLNRDKNYYRLRISTESTRTFSAIIDPHLLEAFRYKLPHVAP